MPSPRRAHDPVLLLRGVSKTFYAGVPGCAAAARVLARIDLIIHTGERVLVVGARGSGKTTLLLLAAGLLAPDRGFAWRAAGGVLAGNRWRGTARTPIAGVAEPPPHTVPAEHELLVWSVRGGESALLVAGGAGVDRACSRVLLLVNGVLHPLDGRGAPAGLMPPSCGARRVDSRSGAP